MPSRAFLAIDLPCETIALLAEAGSAVAAADLAWRRERWVRPELLHVTVKFIGPLPDPCLKEACRRIGEACARCAPFETEVRDILAVRSARAARMLWVTMTQPAEASEAARVLDSVLARRFDVPASEHPFSAHVTLARAKRPVRITREALDAGSAVLASGKDADRRVSVRSFTLYSSTLSPTGPTYDALARFPLGVAGCQTDRLD